MERVQQSAAMHPKHPYATHFKNVKHAQNIQIFQKVKWVQADFHLNHLQV